ncbi:MAG: alpha-(1-_3)-arabinofuranosyltransferase [Janibacter sp.]|nr:alpha-(1->3)-arabinofuranosyltransferase [Janibacter sp.]
MSLLLALVVLLNQVGVFTPDTKPQIFTRPAQTAARYASAWLDTPNLGSSNYNVGVAPIAALFAPLEAMGVPPWLIQRGWRILLLLVAGWGAREVMRHVLDLTVAPRMAVVATTAAAIAYAANPYTLIGGGTTPTLLPYALLPWLVLCWWRGFRTPTWRLAVIAALILAAMGGLNAGVVPILQLIVIIPLVAHATLIEGHRLVTVVGMIVRTGLVYTLLSAYWLVPALVALGSGISVAESTESTAAINMTNSFPEVLRGLGMWTLYGVGGDGPFDPHRLSYVLSPVVILLTFGGPLLAAIGVRLSRSPARLFGATSMLVGALVMVGSFSAGDPTLWGRWVGATIENVPGFIAFRTTNKAGAVLELGLAVLIGVAAAEIATRIRSSGQRLIALTATAALVAAGVAPAWSGDMFWIPMKVPGYWTDAAETVNARGHDSRVLMVPGAGVPDYSWGYSGPDEIGPSLFTRPFTYRSAGLPGGPYAANLMAGVDLRLQEGTLPPGTTSALARYIGAGDVVGRYDVRKDSQLGSRVERQLDEDEGLGGPVVFGPVDAARGAPGPATVRRLTGAVPQTSVSARSAEGALVIDGGGGALPSLVSTGLLKGEPGLLLAGALDDDALATALQDGGAIVLTDSNARREWSTSDPAVTGELLSASEAIGDSRALFDADQQTTAVVEGATVTTRGSGRLFGPYAYGGVQQAFDGDLTTAWQFGDFGTGVGNAVVVTPEEPTAMPSVTLTQNQSTFTRITSARLTAQQGGRSITKDVTFPEWGTFPVTVGLGEKPVTEVEIEVTGVAAVGDGPVGFSEISIPGVSFDRVATLPSSSAERVARVASAAGIDLGTVPVEVVMHRNSGDVNGQMTEEALLEREFTVPDERRFDARGSVRLAQGISDKRIDELADAQGEVTAESSSRAFGKPQARASMAFDGRAGTPDQSTAWVPSEPVVGEWITLDFPKRKLSSFTFTQDGEETRATKALVAINDEEPFEVDLKKGTTRIRLPEAVKAHRVRILLTERTGGGFVRVTDIGLPRIETPSLPKDQGCFPITDIDDQPLMVDVGDQYADLLAGKAVAFESCGRGIALGADSHRVRPDAAFAIDDLRLSSTDHVPPHGNTREKEPADPDVEVIHHGPSSMDVRLADSCAPCLVSSGQSFDPRWTASVAGRDLGPPVVVDGYAAGWRVDAEPGQIVQITFAPARLAGLAWLLSGAVFVSCLALLAWPGLRRRRRRRRESS